MANTKKPSKTILSLYNLMKSGKPVKTEEITATLDCSVASAMVYICTLRKDFNAEIQTNRNGRKAESYTLTNASKIASRMESRVPKATATKKMVTVNTRDVEDGSVPIIDRDFDTVSEAEFNDLKMQLGI